MLEVSSDGCRVTYYVDTLIRHHGRPTTWFRGLRIYSIRNERWKRRVVGSSANQAVHELLHNKVWQGDIYGLQTGWIADSRPKGFTRPQKAGLREGRVGRETLVKLEPLKFEDGSQVQWFRRQGRTGGVGRSCRTKRAQGDACPPTPARSTATHLQLGRGRNNREAGPVRNVPLPPRRVRSYLPD